MDQSGTAPNNATFKSHLDDSMDEFGHGESDVFVCRPQIEAAQSSTQALSEGVTLFVYGWDNVEPGSLSWVFPNVRAALDAVKTMRNAVRWCIVSGDEWPNVEHARAEGTVLVEELG